MATVTGFNEEFRKISLIVACLTVAFISIVNAVPPDYWNRREQVLYKEEFISLGGNIRLNDEEQTVNAILMDAKYKEYDEGIKDPEKFLPAHNFMAVKNNISQSDVFKIIQQLPKGAVLHAHSSAFVSVDYLYWNITFRDNLYVCDRNGSITLKFAWFPGTDCEWTLLSKLREDETKAGDINYKLFHGMTMLTANPDETYPNGNAAWTKFQGIFEFIKPLHSYRPVFEDYLYRGLEEHYNDNVMYIELRTTFSPLHEINGAKYSRMQTAAVYQNVAKKFMKDHPDFIGLRIIYAPHRSISQEALNESLETASALKHKYPGFIAGFDLVGQEDKGNSLTTYANRLKAAYPTETYFFHAGETDWYGTSIDENLVDAVLLNAKRIGHGYALAKHPIVMDIVRQKNIAVEVNPISNQVLGLVKDLRNHPANIFFSQGLPVVISNDDPGHWGSEGLSYDFYEAFMGMMSREADLRSLKQLALNSLLYSSMGDSEKRRAIDVWERKWHEFVINIISMATTKLPIDKQIPTEEQTTEQKSTEQSEDASRWPPSKNSRKFWPLRSRTRA